MSKQKKISNLLYQINNILIEFSGKENNEHNENELFNNSK